MINYIIFDWKRTLYDPEKRTLIRKARQLLEYLGNKKIPMVLVGKGGTDMQKEVDRLKVRRFFKKIVFSEGDKDPKIFSEYILKENPKSTVFIGDRVRSEISIGKKLSATTIWVKQGKFAIENPENDNQKPDFVVESLADCLKLMQGATI